MKIKVKSHTYNEVDNERIYGFIIHIKLSESDNFEISDFDKYIENYVSSKDLENKNKSLKKDNDYLRTEIQKFITRTIKI